MPIPKPLKKLAVNEVEGKGAFRFFLILSGTPKLQLSMRGLVTGPTVISGVFYRDCFSVSPELFPFMDEEMNQARLLYGPFDPKCDSQKTPEDFKREYPQMNKVVKNARISKVRK